MSGSTAGGTAAAGTATQAGAAPAVFIHVRNEATREQMFQLERAFAAQGLRLAGVKVVATGPSASDLRYFHDGEQDEAADVQESLLALGLPVRQVKRIRGFERVAAVRQYEIWLAGDFTGAVRRN